MDYLPIIFKSTLRAIFTLTIIILSSIGLTFIISLLN